MIYTLLLEAFLHPGQPPAKTGAPDDPLAPHDRKVIQVMIQ
jgi:hypothetical protein